MTQIVRWRPARDLQGLWGDFDRWFDLAPRLVGRQGDGWFSPACEVVEGENATVLRFDVPGVDPERDLEVTVEGDTLVVRGERRRAEETSTYRESGYGRFERCMTLPKGTDPENVAAHYDRGVLEVTLPTAPALEARKVPITHVALGTDVSQSDAAA